MKTAAIILAGGTGRRFNDTLPKQFIKLKDKFILSYSIEKFYGKVDIIVVVCHKDYISFLENEFKNSDFLIVEGGETRQMSVRNGLLRLKNEKINYVAIHDSARPLFSVDLIKRLFDAVEEKKAVIPAVPVSSTIARVENENITEYLPREEFFIVQTPQVFEYNLIFEAHEKAFINKKTDFTDDSQVVRFIGKTVYTISGEETNIKITTKSDFLIAEGLLSRVK